MQNQFVDLSAPDFNTYYYYEKHSRARYWTRLMKLVLTVRDFPCSIDKIKKIITNNPEEIHKKNSRGVTALMIAAINCSEYSNIECVKLLIASSANVNDEDNNKMSCLMWASRLANSCSSTECVKLLIDSGADTAQKDNENWNSLMHASRWAGTDSNIECVRLLINCDPGVIKLSNSLSTATLNINSGSSLECVQLLLDSGAIIERGLLSQVCCCVYTTSSIECVKLLIKYGANVNETYTKILYTPLLLVTPCANTVSGIECIKLLIDNGADINYIDYHGSYCLKRACIGNYDIECVRLLIDLGANINLCVNNETLLMHVYRYSTDDKVIELMNFLIKKGAVIDKIDSNGNTILMLMAGGILRDRFCKLDCMKLLIKSGSNVNIKNNCGENSLMMACDRAKKDDSLKYIELLINSGCDVNEKSIDGTTSLMYLFSKQKKFTQNFTDVLMLLIHKSRLTISDKNDDGKTAYDLYMENNFSILSDDQLEYLSGHKVIGPIV